MKKNFKKGFGLIEIIVAASIATITLVGLVYTFQTSLKITHNTGQKVGALMLLEEGVEVVRIMRDTSWTNLSLLTTDTDYYLVFFGGTWSTTTENFLVDGIFERTFQIQNVYRDSNDDIASTGTYDENTKQVDVSVSWYSRGATTTESISTYFTNIF